MDRRVARLAGIVCAALLSLAPAAAQEPTGPLPGDVIVVAGQVVDATGAPVADVQVLLEASRSRFSLRRMGRVQDEPLRVPARTDDDGRFDLSWTWDPHYNTFTLAVGLDLGSEGFEILERRDLTDLMAAGSVPPVWIEVENAGFLRWLVRYLQGDASADEIKIFRDKGRPDRVRPSEHFPGETTWWYFTEGKSYRFVDGRFERVEHFDPIPAPEAATEGS